MKTDAKENIVELEVPAHGSKHPLGVLNDFSKVSISLLVYAYDKRKLLKSQAIEDETERQHILYTQAHVQVVNKL